MYAQGYKQKTNRIRGRKGETGERKKRNKQNPKERYYQEYYTIK
jgi:hypothetical protein